jgi:hypothetical protein
MERRQILVYRKNPVPVVDECILELQRRNYDVKTLTYGSYSKDQYLKELRRCAFMVGFSFSESQGIAWTEAWSTNVPTLLWYQDGSVHRGQRLSSSTAPYLSASTGMSFQDLPEFRSLLDRWNLASRAFRPRHWVLENMSDRVSARALCCLAEVHF